nr:PAS domain S-box protein [candidate division KSB1 bacterium]NIS26467.1 PAS domain S-box protein [candidate division KSB1 bacterium]NIT73233.1 PAS domain S-box protein [candidate division KSB1 bacterium]NIU27151.1 PAS domain S-box protein [candidate division KSB1 bacterium]NIU93177.1 PAS domain S-box protein [candidate division KSB1 bacterium]
MKPLRENQKLRLETPIKKANQKTFKALVSLASFKDRNGIVTTLGYFVNLSDADKEAELKEIQSRFNALLGNSGLILVNLSPDFLITDLNEQALKTFNWEKENVTQRNFFEVILPGDEWKKTLEETRNRLSEENTSELENQSVLSDKTQHTFSWSLAKETDPKDETIKGYIAIAKDITEFKEAQNSLKENEVLLNSIVDKSNDAFIAIDENGIIQSFNTGAEHLFGYSSDEILGQNVSNLMPEPYSKEHDNYLSRFLETGRSKLVGGPPREFVGKRKNGSIFPFEITVREMYKGYQRLFVGIGQDISKRKALEVALNENREKFRRFMEAESNAVIIIDSVSQQIIEHNDAALQMYGYESDDLLNLTFQNLLAKPDSSEEGAESSTSPGLGSVNKTALLYQKKKDGTVFPSHITTNSFLVQDQNMELKIIRDTSSQVRLEENFKEAEGHLRNVLNSVDSAIFLKDRSGKFTLVNAAFERLFNKTNEEIKGKTAEEVFPGEYLEALFSGDSSVYEAASPLEGK